jgi:hypothetical protein
LTSAAIAVQPSVQFTPGPKQCTDPGLGSLLKLLPYSLGLILVLLAHFLGFVLVLLADSLRFFNHSLGLFRHNGSSYLICITQGGKEEAPRAANDAFMQSFGGDCGCNSYHVADLVFLFLSATLTINFCANVLRA